MQNKPRQCLGRPKDAAKREGIVRAARKLFMDQGYELTSVEAVAKMAEVSKLTIYSHFANKSELFKEVIQEGCNRQMAPDNFLNYAQLPLEEGLFQLARTITALVFSEDSLRLLRIIQSEAVQHPQIVKIFYQAGPQRVKAAFGELLQHWGEQGKLTIPDIPVATEQFFSLLKGEAHVKAMMNLDSGFNQTEMDAHIRVGVSLFLAGYQSKSSGETL